MTGKEEDTKENESFLNDDEIKKHEFTEKDEYARVPIDRGWAWMILFGGVLTMAVVVGCIRTGGIMFVEFQRKFQSTSSMTSAITTVQNAVFCVSSPVIMTVGIKLVQCRIIVFTGSIILCLSYILNGLASNIHIVMISHGIIQGFGIACVEPTSISMVSKYFKKRRSLSNSLVSGGNSIGGLIFPPLVTKLFDFYGYMGCMIITGAVHLHICVPAMLYRPLEFYKVHKKHHHSNGISQAENEGQSKKSSQVFLNLLRVFNFKLFLNPLFLIFQVAFGLLTSAAVLSIMYVPPNAKHLGVSDDKAALLLSIFSGVDFFGRVLNGVIADTNIIRRSTLVAVSGTIFGISTICVRFYTSFELLVMHVVIIGATSGSVKSLYPGIIVDYLSLKNLDSTIGFAMLTLGLTNGIFIFIGGYLKDTTGSFVATFYLVGTLALGGSVAMFALQFVQKRLHPNTDAASSTLTDNLPRTVHDTVTTNGVDK